MMIGLMIGCTAAGLGVSYLLERLEAVDRARAERARLYAQHPSPLTRAGLVLPLDYIRSYRVAVGRAWVRAGGVWSEMCWISKTPDGWVCARVLDHEGPCAAWLWRLQ